MKNVYSRRRSRPCALTVAGSDSGGGAGIQADLKTFAALQVHGTCAITCVTAQNPEGVRSIDAVSPKVVADQVEAVFDSFSPAAVKTGMLYSKSIIQTVAAALSGRNVTLIVDPVMVATSGSNLLKPHARAALLDMLLPLATLLTPNVPEAEEILGLRLAEPEDLREAAREIHARFGCAALVKGGHLQSAHSAVDIFFDGKTELLLEAPFVHGVSTHGTGCTFSAAIAAHCALGAKLPAAVFAAKQLISNSIANSYRTGRHYALGIAPIRR